MTAVPGSTSQPKKPRHISPASGLVKSLDAVLTAPLKPRAGAGQLLWSVIRPGSSPTNRISSLTNLLGRLVPGLSQRLNTSLLRMNHFPLHGFSVKLMAYGSGATVFLLTNDREQKVLKVFRRSLARPADEALEVAKEFAEKHRRLVAWFNDPYQVVVPSTFLVLHGPLIGAGAAAVLQPYVAGKKQDIFHDYTLDQAVQLLRSNPHLKEQWVDFAQRFLRSMEETNTCFDIVGRENLMLVETEGALSFKITDNGLFNIPSIQAHAPALYARLQAHLERMRQIMNAMERS